jgi:hypothetical protein
LTLQPTAPKHRENTAQKHYIKTIDKQMVAKFSAILAQLNHHHY